MAPELLIGGLDRNAATPLHRQLYEGLRDSILDGRLRLGASMPPTRDLPGLLGVSRTTVISALNQLHSDGFIEPRVGSGTYVADSIPDRYRAASRALGKEPTPGDPPRLSAQGQRMIDSPTSVGALWRRPEAFYPGLPDVDLLPLQTWRRVANRRGSLLDSRHLGYGQPGGYEPLRTAIAEYVADSRGLRCRPEQVIVVSGAQQGMDLTARLLVDVGDQVWLEDPGYRGARCVLQAAGADVVPVPVDNDGIIVDAGISRAPSARLAYVTPSHQYPLGYSLSSSRRRELLKWATENDSWVVEHDHDGVFRYEGRPQAALQGISDRVVYIGTFSKVLFPSLRLGYVIVPEFLIDAFCTAQSLIDRHQSTVTQAVVADFITEGHFVRHIRRARIAYAERQQCMLQSLVKETAGMLHVAPASGGMSLIGWLPPGVLDLRVSEILAAKGICAPPLSFSSMVQQPRGALILGYSGFSPARIKVGAAKLGVVLREAVDDSRARSRRCAPVAGPAVDKAV